MIRTDFNLSDSDSLFVRYTVDDANRLRPLDFAEFTREGTTRTNFFTVSESHTFGSTLVGTFKYSFSKATIGIDSVVVGADLSGPQFVFVPGRDQIGRLDVRGTTRFGSDTNTPALDHTANISTYSADLFTSKGRHSLKFGALWNHYHPFKLSSATTFYGSVSFSNVRDFLRGDTSGYSARNPESAVCSTPLKGCHGEYDMSTFGFYLQDDVRVRSNLTLNLGLRYEFRNTPTERNGRNSHLKIDAAEPTLGPVFGNPSKTNISPRFGFAWDVRGDGRTAVRGGFAILYDVGAWTGYLNMVFKNTPPFGSSSSVNVDTYPDQATITQLPLVFPAGAKGTGASTFDINVENPHMMTYNFTIERQLPGDMGITVAYAGSRGINLLSNKAGNPRVQTPCAQSQECMDAGRGDDPLYWDPVPRASDLPDTPLGNDRVNPNWSGITFYTANASSWYNSFQFSIRKRMSRGLQFQSAYTWGKNLDFRLAGTRPDQGGSSNIGTRLTPLSVDKGRADGDATHSWRVNAIYDLPQSSLTGVGGALLNGWRISGILSTQTGYPFTPSAGGRSDLTRSLGAGNKPDLASGRNNDNITSGTSTGCSGRVNATAGTQLGTQQLWFDPCAFSRATRGFIGTVPRNILNAPGLANLDFSMVKDTKLGILGESGNLQFRWEIFNIFNRVNFALPSELRVDSADAGQITFTNTPSRKLQLALKVIW